MYRQIKTQAILTLVLVLCVSYCTDSPEHPRSYLADALELIHDDAIYADRLDWDSLENTLEPLMDTISSYQTAHKVIQDVLRAIDDNHSGFAPYPTWQGWETERHTLPVEFEVYPGGISYIMVPGYHGPISERSDFAAEICRAVESIRSTSQNGVIIDLRWHSGGRLGPDLAGLGAFFSRDTVGYFVYKNSEQAPVFFSDNTLYFGESAILSIPEEYRHVSERGQFDDVPVVLLTSPYTGSAGEMVLISLMARENVYIIGDPTNGVPTPVGSYFLPDSSLLGLAVAFYADANGKVFETSIQPNQVTASALIKDQPIHEAIAYLKDIQQHKESS